MSDSKQAGLLWYGIHVRSKCEHVASTALAAKGYEQFLPLYRSRRIWSDRAKLLDLPLFPGYFFCRLDVHEKLLPVLTSPGVVSIVGAGNSPVAIPDGEIEAIRRVVSSGLEAQPWQELAVGSRVLIRRGPLAGIEGTTVDIGKQYRIIVSIPLLQRSVAVEIDREWVCDTSLSAVPLASDSSEGENQAGIS